MLNVITNYDLGSSKCVAPCLKPDVYVKDVYLLCIGSAL